MANILLSTAFALTDTFQLGETRDSEELFSEIFPQNSKRVQQQQKTPLRVIIGNPPYSIGQKSANDNAQNQEYHHLNQRVMNTYVAKSTAGLNKSSYDAYIRAFRWASDRLDPIHGGVICFVSNGAWIDGNSTDGFRKSIETEFSSIYVFNLRGNATNTAGNYLRQKEARQRLWVWQPHTHCHYLAGEKARPYRQSRYLLLRSGRLPFARGETLACQKVGQCRQSPNAVAKIAPQRTRRLDQPPQRSLFGIYSPRSRQKIRRKDKKRFLLRMQLVLQQTEMLGFTTSLNARLLKI
jgi:hypothetical protein